MRFGEASLSVASPQDIWWLHSGPTSSLVPGDGCFYRTQTTPSGRSVCWRVFVPWENRQERTDDQTGGHCLHDVPAALWKLQYSGHADHYHLDVAFLLERVAETMKLGITSFLREFGPSKSGPTLCGVEFTSKDTCVTCGESHDSSYRLAAIEFTTQHGTATKVLLYTPCQERGREVLQRGGSRRLTDRELESMWRDTGAGVSTAKATFAEALARIVGGVTWEDKVVTATDAIDVGNGKELGTSAHYRGTMTLPDSKGAVQPRFVVRVAYTVKDGLQIFNHYPKTGLTYPAGPTGAVGKERPAGVEEFSFDRPV